MAALAPAHLNIIETEQSLLQGLLKAVEHTRLKPRGAAALPDLRRPYVAHLCLETGGGTRDLLLGFTTLIDTRHRVSLLDWRTAPLSVLLFTHEAGERYEIELEEGNTVRSLSGRVLHKRWLTFEAGELIRIEADEVALIRAPGAPWRAEAPRPVVHLVGGSGGSLPRKLVNQDLSGRRIPVVTDLLDNEQRALLQRDSRRPLLILGGAGCGKTTVALHRLAHLHHGDPRRFSPKRLVVVVPEEGLMRLTAAILEELGLANIRVFTFDGWIAGQARRVFRDLPRRLCEDPPGRVVHFKRHPALRVVLPQLVQHLTQQLARQLDRRLAARGRFAREFGEREEPTLLQRLNNAEQHELSHSSRHLHPGIRALFSEQRQRLHRARPDLLLLFGDRELLMHAVQHSAGELTSAMVQQVIEHTRRQFSSTSDEAFAHVDADRRQAVDGLGLDQGTPQEVAQTIDAEDFAVCFELLRLKTGGLSTPHGSLGHYTHMVLDEAQDLAPIELAVLGRALGRGGSLTVCGDQSQQIDPSACFSGWERALVELGVETVAPAHLRTSYRCSAPITRFAHQVLGPLAPAEMPQSVRPGPDVQHLCQPTEAHAAHAVVQALSELLDRQPGVTVAVITRTRDNARRWFAVLERCLPARLVLDGRFSFTPGIDVTPVSQVKGLEFDVVIVPDATSASYKDEPDARRKLLVACTRAIEMLWVLAVGQASPILPDP